MAVVASARESDVWSVKVLFVKEEDNLLDGLVDGKDEGAEEEDAFEVESKGEELSEGCEELVFLVAKAVNGSEEVVDDNRLAYSYSQTSNY